MTVSFREYLNEAASGKLMHLQHLEDLMLDEGVPGCDFAVTVLREFHHMFHNGGVSRALNVSTKWDGAPSLVFGPDPSDGQFFVATKAAFSKTPKLMKTHQQIHDTYGDSGLANALHTCLTELGALRLTTIVQGDLLFTDDVKEQTIDGRAFLTFRPNTILYAIDATSELGQRIRRAHLGIVAHTMYTGTGQSLANYHATPISPTAFTGLTKSSRILAIDRNFDDVSGTVTFTASEDTDFEMMLSRIQEMRRQIPVAVFAALAMEPLHGLIQMFINAQTRAGTRTRVSHVVEELLTFITMRRDKELSAAKTVKNQQSIEDRFAHLIEYVMQNATKIVVWFTLHQEIAGAKNMIVHKLSQASQIGTFLPTENGFRVTGHEGYVAVSHSGKMVKLVDRLEFSRANFLAAKAWA